MELQTLQVITIFTSLGFMLAQLLIKRKQTAHILFAVFCGSIAMSVTKDLSASSLGGYQYLIGLGACATCNCYWLLSRSLFRGNGGISARHYLLAASIALLIMINQGYLFAHYTYSSINADNNLIRHLLREATVLLSSYILVLSFWEGCRGYSSCSPQEKYQRLLFLATFGCAVATAKMARGVFSADLAAQEMVISAIILFVLINTQILLVWRFKSNPLTTNSNSDKRPEQQELAPEAAKSSVPDETPLAEQIEKLIVRESLFLQPNLKMADVARKLDVPEYRISNAVRHNLDARNFNQYINELRVKHAQVLLSDSDKQKWSVLVIGLESGFSSAGSFTRAFKSNTGLTPNQYRQQCLSQELELA
ncbi:AraC family transcriptional regulator [Pleionea sp. CnH1-48]|uniref:helix-turn-helix domain-containing protein n=1 Tax=Pleionea sp. CnH1-48 TaxID=2954494 RepID=UPI0020983C88|nr:helix-turn-helix transcriptional regulator [Pleionea sp. CnH1-48]MCO7222859.1 helix-turn-helix transcriptional regulator [Pleionea sp. CnH1-48]